MSISELRPHDQSGPSGPAAVLSDTFENVRDLVEVIWAAKSDDELVQTVQEAERLRYCAFPGCTWPPVMCHAHHIIHWLHGGETKLSIWWCCAATTTGSSTTPPGNSD